MPKNSLIMNIDLMQEDHKLEKVTSFHFETRLFFWRKLGYFL